MERFTTITRSEELAESLVSHLLIWQGASFDEERATAFVESALSQLRWQYAVLDKRRFIDSVIVDEIVGALVSPEDLGASKIDQSDANKALLMGDIKRIVELCSQYVGVLSADAVRPLPGGLQTQVLNRTSSGLFLRFKDGLPSGILTPWGLWPLLQKQPLRMNVPGFMNHFMTRVYSPVRRTGQHSLGPTYEVLMIGDQVLPTPSFSGDRLDKTDHGVIHGEWERLYGS